MRQDAQEFVPVTDRARVLHGGFQTQTVLPDAGYDSDANCGHVKTIGASPISKAMSLRKHFHVDDPALPRDSEQWTRVHNMRQAMERCISGLKGHRALDTHCRRGLARVGLHCVLALLVLQAAAVVAGLTGQMARMAACTRRVA